MFNNPYNNYYPFINQANPTLTRGISNNIGSNLLRPGLLAGIRSIKWGSILSNTQKTLNVINQAIPVYYQIKPIWQNVKSFNHILSAFNEPDKPTEEVNNPKEEILEKKGTSLNHPTFFIQ